MCTIYSFLAIHQFKASKSIKNKYILISAKQNIFIALDYAFGTEQRCRI